MTKLFKSFKFIFLLFCVCAIIPFVSLFGSVDTSYASSNDFFVQYTTAYNQNGTIYEMLDFGIRAKSINASATEVELYKQKAVSFINELLNEKINAIKNKYLLSSQPEEYNYEGNISYSATYVSSSDSVCYLIEYSSSTIFNFYNEDAVYTIKEGFFVSKSTKTQEFYFSKVNSAGKTLAQEYKERFLSAVAGLSFENTLKNSYSPKYIYDYITGNSRVKSNADSIVKDNGGYYHHLWSNSGDCANAQNVIITRSVIHAGWWYFLGVAIPLAVMIIAIIIVKIQNKKKKTNKDIEVKQEN